MDETFPPSDLDHFQRNGFVIARGLASPGVVAAMRQVTLEGIERHIPPIEYEADLHYPGAPESRDAEGGRTARRLKMALGRSPVFIEFLSQPAVVGRLQQLLGPQVVCPLAHHNCIMTKQPEFSSETGWHQDVRYWSFTRPDLVSAWLALGAERPQNGCLWVIPGSHRMNLERFRFDDALFFRTDLADNQPILATKIPVELNPGDVLFFHARTLHSASRNETSATKYSVVFTFRREDNLPLKGSRSAAAGELILPEA